MNTYSILINQLLNELLQFIAKPLYERFEEELKQLTENLK